jgi:hypothetical protein
VGPIKLKGVDLPTFDGEDKVEYEQWKAAFTSAVDYADIPVKGIWQYIFLLFHFKELLKLYVNLFYRFCVTLLFPEIFEQKKSQISEFSAILDFGGYACDIISRVTQELLFN